MSKFAFCIITHRFSPVLVELIQCMKNEENQFFIHVDKKTDLSSYSLLFSIKNVIFVKERVDVKWGQVSQIDAYLNTLKYCINNSFNRIFLLSGDTLPLRNLAFLEKYCDKYSDMEFVSYKECLDAYVNRVRYDHSLFYGNVIKRFVYKVRNKLGIRILNPNYEILPQLCFGSNWIGITSQCLNYIFDYLYHNPLFYDAFKVSVCGDELFFQTIIMDSSFSNRVKTEEMMYVDWGSLKSHPKTLQNEDYDNLLRVPESYLFARKFSSTINIDKYERIFLC